jgi:hypothetical protein
MFNPHQPPDKIASELAALGIMKATSGETRSEPQRSRTPDWNDPFTFWSRVVVAAIIGIPLIVFFGWLMSLV